MENLPTAVWLLSSEWWWIRIRKEVKDDVKSKAINKIWFGSIEIEIDFQRQTEQIYNEV